MKARGPPRDAGPPRTAARLVAGLLWLHFGAAAISVPALLQQFHSSQRWLAANWQYDPLLVCRPAGLHGAVPKRAPGSMFVNMLVRNQTLIDTVRAAGLPVFAGIQVYISHRFRFIYLRQPKASSTSILLSIQKQFCGGAACESHEFARVDDGALANGTLDDATWRRYFVFTAVRNPIARMLSTYNMFSEILHRRPRPGARTPGQPCGVPFAAYARDVGLLRDVCDSEQCCSWMGSDGGDVFVPNFPNQHITLQAHSFITPEGESAVDYIARTERIEEDWREIVALIQQRTGRKERAGLRFVHENAHAARAAPPLGTLPRHPCLAPDVAAQNFLNESTVRAIAHQFALDLTALRFLPSAELQAGGVVQES